MTASERFVTDRTETNAVDGARDDTRLVPYLFVVLEGGRPLAGGARLRCDELEAIAIGRGDTRAAAIEGRGATLALPDRRLSSAHARIERADRGWVLVDAGSKNGCRVDGVETRRQALRDGAWIELGQTVLRFRTALPVAEPAWLDAEHATPVLGLVTLVPSFADAIAEVARIASSQVPLLITGETGTGKELLARAVHAASGRSGPFVAVNCAALSAGLVESQLFGHRRGAFSGAVADHEGFVRAAHGGTLLLDEVGDLPLPAQAALLRVVQEKEVVPVGDTRGVGVDVRFVAATHHDLRARIADGALREDLYARLAGYVAKLPPLSARREDLGTIAAVALRRHAGDRAGVRLTGAAAIQLATVPWPHNARELDKAIEAALALTEGDERAGRARRRRDARAARGAARGTPRQHQPGRARDGKGPHADPALAQEVQARPRGVPALTCGWDDQGRVQQVQQVQQAATVAGPSMTAASPRCTMGRRGHPACTMP